MGAYTLEEQVDELKKELATREKTFPRLIWEGRIKREEADLRTAILKSIIAKLERELKKKIGEQLNLL